MEVRCFFSVRQPTNLRHLLLHQKLINLGLVSRLRAESLCADVLNRGFKLREEPKDRHRTDTEKLFINQDHAN